MLEEWITFRYTKENHYQIWIIFQHVTTWQKLRLWQNPFWTYVIQILPSEIQSEGRYYFSSGTKFWSWDLIWKILAILYQLLHNFYFKGLKKYPG